MPRFCYNEQKDLRGADCRFFAGAHTAHLFFRYFSGKPFSIMNISYDSYRIFYYAAKYRSFSQAAAALYNNQPNVTRMIRRLESELGCALFFRSPQGVRLTPEGEKLYAHIAVAFESIEAGEAEILSDQSLQSGIVHIAASSLALRARILQVLARYRREYPHVRICLTNHSAPDGLAAVQNGLADFAILAKGASVPDSLSAQKIDEIQEIPICGSAFPELTKEAVSLQKLAEYPIISLIRVPRRMTSMQSFSCVTISSSPPTLRWRPRRRCCPWCRATSASALCRMRCFSARRKKAASIPSR